MYRRLRDLREDHDLPQRALAELLHVSQATYSRYESGDLDIPSGALIALAKHYHTSIDYLLGITDGSATSLVKILRLPKRPPCLLTKRPGLV